MLPALRRRRKGVAERRPAPAPHHYSLLRWMSHSISALAVWMSFPGSALEDNYKLDEELDERVDPGVVVQGLVFFAQK